MAGFYTIRGGIVRQHFLTGLWSLFRDLFLGLRVGSFDNFARSKRFDLGS
jgi:hypothetical protein